MRNYPSLATKKVATVNGSVWKSGSNLQRDKNLHQLLLAVIIVGTFQDLADCPKRGRRLQRVPSRISSLACAGDDEPVDWEALAAEAMPKDAGILTEPVER